MATVIRERCSPTERHLGSELMNSPGSESKPLPNHSVIMVIKVSQDEAGWYREQVFVPALVLFFAGKEMSMENVTNIKNEGLSRIEACESLADLQNLRVLYLGKKRTDPGSDEVNEGSFQRGTSRFWSEGQ